jgi:hypothetical protein
MISHRMKINALVSIMLLLAGSFSPAGQAQEIPSLWQEVGTGIQYREFYLPGPNHLYVARMEQANPLVTLETGVAQGRLSGGLETVREMAGRYNQAIGYWGEEWGRREQVVVAINGSFFNPESGVPTSGQVQAGWYAKRFDERHSGSGFAWTLDRGAFIGGCVVHRPGKQLITHLGTGGTIPFDAINTPRGEDELVVYTPQYDATTLTDEEGLEILVELSRPMLILPEPGMVTGTVRLVRDQLGSTPIPFDAIVLSASGKARDKLKGQLQVGDEIGISQEIRHLEPDCRTASPLSWTKTYASLGASYVLLKDGVLQGNNDLGAVLRNPRTAIAYNQRYIFFIVVDGRDQLRSLGMSMVELGVFAKTSLGAAWGVALDGGGSSTMVVNGEVKNYPNANLPDQNPGPEAQTPQPTSGPAAPADGRQRVERAVANGLMMVVVQPRETSARFKPGDPVATVDSETLLRLGPGTNYAILSVLAPGSAGVVVDHPLNGVLAKDHYWWKVAFGELVGWVSESLLVSQP